MDQGFVFDALREYVNADIDLVETSRRRLEQLDHIQSPTCKGPRCRDHLQNLNWDVGLFGKKLVVLTSANECFSISYG